MLHAVVLVLVGGMPQVGHGRMIGEAILLVVCLSVEGMIGLLKVHPDPRHAALKIDLCTVR